MEKCDGRISVSKLYTRMIRWISMFVNIEITRPRISVENYGVEIIERCERDASSDSYSVIIVCVMIVLNGCI